MKRIRLNPDPASWPHHVSTHFTPRRFASREEWRRYADWLARQARVSLGLLPEPRRTPLRARIFERVEKKGYTCEKVYFESMPGYYVTGNLFRPLGRPRRKGPGILCPHGHWAEGRLHDHDAACSIIARCMHLARMGATVFSYDMVGYNDSCQLQAHRGIATLPGWGFSVMSLQTWNSVRAIDFLQSLDGVDPRRIGVTGASGGGTQTFVLMAVDERVTAAAPMVMVGYTMQGGCHCENHPLLRIDNTNIDLCRLFAPKPALIGSCSGDWTRDVPKVEIPAIRQVYRFYNAEDRVYGCHQDAGHNYNQFSREAVYGFFNRHLFGARSADPLAEEPLLERPSLRERMLWWGRPAPPRMTDREIHDLWKAHIESGLAAPLRSPAETRRVLGPLLPHVLGITLTSVGETARARRRGIRVAAEGSRLVVTPGAPAREPPRGTTFFETYNRVPFAERVHEVLAAVEGAGGRVRLEGRGEAGLWCLFAAACSRRVQAVDADLRGFDYRNERSWTARVGLPSIHQVGGLATVFACIGARKLKLRNAAPATLRLAAR